MKKTVGPIVALLCTVVLGGCATEPRAGSDSAGATTTSAKTAPPSAPAADRVAAVSFRRSGGLKPVQVNRVFRAGHAPPQGFTSVDLKRVLRAAQALVSAGPHVRPMPANTCCDRYMYSVSILLSDGTTKSYTTVDGLNQPKAFTDLLSRLA